MDMRTGFEMHGHNIGAGINKAFQVFFRLHDHQMYIQREVCNAPASFDNIRTKGDIGHITAVHHIDMDHISPTLFTSANINPQVGKISRQD